MKQESVRDIPLKQGSDQVYDCKETLTRIFLQNYFTRVLHIINLKFYESVNCKRVVSFKLSSPNPIIVRTC